MESTRVITYEGQALELRPVTTLFEVRNAQGVLLGMLRRTPDGWVAKPWSGNVSEEKRHQDPHEAVAELMQRKLGDVPRGFADQVRQPIAFGEVEAVPLNLVANGSRLGFEPYGKGPAAWDQGTTVVGALVEGASAPYDRPERMGVDAQVPNNVVHLPLKTDRRYVVDDSHGKRAMTHLVGMLAFVGQSMGEDDPLGKILADAARIGETEQGQALLEQGATELDDAKAFEAMGAHYAISAHEGARQDHVYGRVPVDEWRSTHLSNMGRRTEWPVHQLLAAALGVVLDEPGVLDEDRGAKVHHVSARGRKAVDWTWDASRGVLTIQKDEDPWADHCSICRRRHKNDARHSSE